MRRPLRLLYQPYKWLVYAPLLGSITVAVFILLVLGRLVAPVLTRRVIPRWWARACYSITPARARTTGDQDLDTTRSYVVVANHISQFDIFLLHGWLDLDLKWVMKKELRKAPIIGAASALMGHVFLDRSDREDSIRRLQQLRQDLRPGMSVMFFPEGTRSRGGQLMKFKKGAFMTAKDLGLPILPVTIQGTYRILPPDTMDLYPGTGSLHIHPPVEVDEVQSLPAEELGDKVRGIIASAIDD